MDSEYKHGENNKIIARSLSTSIPMAVEMSNTMNYKMCSATENYPSQMVKTRTYFSFFFSHFDRNREVIFNRHIQDYSIRSNVNRSHFSLHLLYSPPVSSVENPKC